MSALGDRPMRAACPGCGLMVDSEGDPNVMYIGGPYLGTYFHKFCGEEAELLENLKRSVALPDRKGLRLFRGSRV